MIWHLYLAWWAAWLDAVNRYNDRYKTGIGYTYRSESNVIEMRRK